MFSTVIPPVFDKRKCVQAQPNPIQFRPLSRRLELRVSLWMLGKDRVDPQHLGSGYARTFLLFLFERNHAVEFALQLPHITFIHGPR